jgi:hypothetical protein
MTDWRMRSNFAGTRSGGDATLEMFWEDGRVKAATERHTFVRERDRGQ